MRLAATAALTLAVAGLLSWLSIQSVGPLGQDYVFAQRDVARVSLAEAALQADVLQARVGLLRNYDPIVQDMSDLRRSAQELHLQAKVMPKDAPVLDEIEALVARDETAVEHFKTDNALLQNSLTNLDTLDMRLAGAPVTAPWTQGVVALVDAVFHLNRDASADAQMRMQQKLDRLAPLVAAEIKDGNDDLRLLMLHGRLLVRLLPQVNSDLHAILGISTFAPRQVIRHSQDTRREAKEKLAARFRLGLTVTAVALVVLLARVGQNWNASRQILRRRTLAETQISLISAQLAGAPSEDFIPVLESALQQIALILAADRIWLVMEGMQPEFLSLPKRPLNPNEDPPDPRDYALPEGEERIFDFAALPPGPLRDGILAEGVAQWFGIRLNIDRRRYGLFAFATQSRLGCWPALGLGVAQRAAEVLQGAVLGHCTVRQRAEFQARLDRGRRMEAIGTFASGIAHNFNNVLGAITGHAEMAAEIPSLPGSALSHVTDIQRAVQRAQDLVGNILSFGARRPAQHRNVAVDGLLAEALGHIRIMMPVGVELVVEPSAPGAHVRGDVAQLQQVLVNLVLNAVQAIWGAGRLTVTVDLQEPRSAVTLSHGRVTPGRYVRLRVADTGTGMSAETLANIFEPFFTTRPAGTGLGLATIREIVQDHQGSIDVRTASGQGSVFSVWLKVIEPPATHKRVISPVGLSVLLVGPDRTTVMQDEDVLAALGFEPFGYDAPSRALEEAARAPERFDTVIVHARRLDDETVLFLHHLRALLVDAPMILVSHEAGDLRSPVLAGLRLVGLLRGSLRSAASSAFLDDLMHATAV